MTEFLFTNLNDILAYVCIACVYVIQIIDIFRNKTKSNTLSLSLKEFVKNNTEEQNTVVSQTIEKFQTTAFRQLADEIVSLKGTITTLRQAAKDSAESDKKLIAIQKEAIQALQNQLAEVNKFVTQLQERVTTEAEINQQRYLKLSKKKEA